MGVCITTERLERRDVSEREERTQWEDEGDPAPDGETSENRFRYECHLHVDGKESRHHVRQKELDGNAKRGTCRRAGETHCRGLGDVDRHYLSARRSKAPQDRHGV